MHSTDISHCVCQAFLSQRRQREAPVLVGLGPDAEAAGSCPMAPIQLAVYAYGLQAGLSSVL